MSVQMTVRIPDDIAAFVDAQVEDGGMTRASVITRALRREQRRRRAERDAEIYAAEPDEDEESVGLWARANAAEVWAELD